MLIFLFSRIQFILFNHFLYIIKSSFFLLTDFFAIFLFVFNPGFITAKLFINMLLYFHEPLFQILVYFPQFHKLLSKVLFGLLHLLKLLLKFIFSHLQSSIIFKGFSIVFTHSYKFGFKFTDSRILNSFKVIDLIF